MADGHSEAYTVSCLMKHFKLKEEHLERETSNCHLDKICLSCCRDWRLLPSQLEMEDHVVENIECDGSIVGEVAKKRAFFLQWKRMKGFDATYKRLVTALLNIKSRKDAESVCKLLQGSHSQQIVSVSTQTANATTGMCRAYPKLGK